MDALAASLLKTVVRHEQLQGAFGCVLLWARRTAAKVTLLSAWVAAALPDTPPSWRERQRRRQMTCRAWQEGGRTSTVVESTLRAF